MEYDIKTNLAGSVFYYKKGTHILHREDGPAIIYKSGAKVWFSNGERHRENGPAIIYENDDQSWYINGKLHRADGPAIDLANGDKEWWINGKRLSLEKETILNEWWDNKNHL